MTQVPESRSLAWFLNSNRLSMALHFSFGRLSADATPPHQTGLLTSVRRLASAFAILTLCVGSLAAFVDGNTPEAPRNCCAQNDDCPIPLPGPDGSCSASMVTQSHAGMCCAASSDRQPGTLVSTFVLSTMQSAAPSVLAATLPAFHSGVQGWRALMSIPRVAVPRHLLLSVFLL